MKETLAYCSRPLPPWGNQSRAASPRLPGVPAGEVHISADHSGYACSRTDLAALPNLAVSPQAGGNTCAAGSLTACGNLSGTNTLMIDPDFNTRVVRVTDANTNPGHLNFTYTAGIGIGGSGVALAPIREFCTSGDERLPPGPLVVDIGRKDLATSSITATDLRLGNWTSRTFAALLGHATCPSHGPGVRRQQQHPILLTRRSGHTSSVELQSWRRLDSGVFFELRTDFACSQTMVQRNNCRTLNPRCDAAFRAQLQQFPVL